MSADELVGRLVAMIGIGLFAVWGLAMMILDVRREDWFKRQRDMDDKEKHDVLTDLRDSVKHLASIVTNNVADDSTRAIMSTQLFLMAKKLEYLLGEG